MTKAITPTDISIKQSDNTKPLQNVDNTLIANRPRKFSFSNDSYLTDLIKPVSGNPNFPLTAKYG